MSKFYAAESSSDTEESTSSEDEIKVTTTRAKPVVQRRFLLSEDEEETTHVVLSAKEKAWEGFKDIIKKMLSARKSKDVTKLLDEFENICKFHTKVRAVVLKEGTPRFFFRCMVETEDFVNELWQNKDAKRKLSKLGTKSLNILRQKLRKYLRDFEREIEDYRNNPDVENEDDDDEDDDVSDDANIEDLQPVRTFLDEPIKAAEVKAPAFIGGDDDDDDDSDDWLSSDDETTSDESEGGEFQVRKIVSTKLFVFRIYDFALQAWNSF